MLILWRRHQKTCPHKTRSSLRCKCPIWVDRRISGKRIRKPIGLRDWARAQQRARDWEAEGFRDAGRVVLIKDACDRFVNDAKARDLKEPTLYKFRLLFRQMQEFSNETGLVFISDFNIDRTREFRESWPNKNLAAKKKLEHLRSFFRFCHDSGWISTNPALMLKPPKITDPAVVPFTPDEITKILQACGTYKPKENAVRLRALVLLLRFTGLRIRDAVTLSRSRIVDGKLSLYTAKTGTPVYCPLPPVVVKALDAIPTGTYFFWTGESKPKSAVGDWQRAMKKLFKLAGVVGHPHKFRHTFATELLQDGVSLDDVAMLLGHRSSKITERHYSHWIRARQENLEARVVKTWARLGHIPELTS
jgi:integrase/recombinase XerD